MRDNTRSPAFPATRSPIALITNDADHASQSTSLAIGFALKISLDHKRPVTEGLVRGGVPWTGP